MPPEAPPKDTVRLRTAVVQADATLWRVHPAKWHVDEFNPTLADAYFGGGRFDPTEEDPYPYLYAAEEKTTAVAEILLRGRRFNGKVRAIQREILFRNSGLCLSALETTEELRLISLRSATDLAAAYQDDWLVQADPDLYCLTRRWARWLREQDPRAQGLIWQSRRDRPNTSLILFGDRCEGLLRASDEPRVELCRPEGIRHLNRLLRPYRACIAEEDQDTA